MFNLGSAQLSPAALKPCSLFFSLLAGSSIISIPGTTQYWAVGTWSEGCDSECRQSRVVACYSTTNSSSGGSGAAAEEAACLATGEDMPDTSRACDSSSCTPSTQSVLRRYTPLIVGVGGGVAGALGESRAAGGAPPGWP